MDGSTSSCVVVSTSPRRPIPSSRHHQRRVQPFYQSKIDGPCRRPQPVLRHVHPAQRGNHRLHSTGGNLRPPHGHVPRADEQGHVDSLQSSTQSCRHRVQDTNDCTVAQARRARRGQRLNRNAHGHQDVPVQQTDAYLVSP